MESRSGEKVHLAFLTDAHSILGWLQKNTKEKNLSLNFAENSFANHNSDGFGHCKKTDLGQYE